MGPIRLRLWAVCSCPLNTRTCLMVLGFNDNVARVDIPFRGNWLLRVDTPFHRWLDPNHSRREQRPRLGQPIDRTRVARLQHARIRLLYRRRLLISHRVGQTRWAVESIRSAQSSPQAVFSLNGSPSCSECSNIQSQPAAIRLDRISLLLKRTYRSIRSGLTVGGASCKGRGKSIGNRKRRAA